MRTLGPLLVCLLACGSHHSGGTIDSPFGGDVDACTGLACFQYDCAVKNLPPTSVSGIVYAPNGTLPLYGVNVYVPASDPGPLPDGATCDQCSNGLLGGSLAMTTTDEAGHFELDDVPATTDVPVVIQVGKWRRQLKLPAVAACQDLPVATADTTLPKSRADLTPNTTSVDMPKVAISTGSADALECLMLKLGIDHTEITNVAGGGRVNLFADTMSGGEGAKQFVSGWPGGSAATFDDSQSLWGQSSSLMPYDIVILSCEGGQYSNTKPQTAMNAMKSYADIGGRVFASHWHNIWIEGATNPATNPATAPAVWPAIATWNNSGTTFNSPPNGTDPPDTIDEANNPKGMSFAKWMLNVGGSPPMMQDVVPIQQGKQTATGVDLMKAERWVYWQDGTTQYPQNFQFTTPNEMPSDQRCGKVVFSDMHVSSGSTSGPGAAYPSTCACGGAGDPQCNSPQAMTPQEKALAFMFFDIASCVSSIQ